MKRMVMLCLATAALVAATLAIWHWRFVAVPDALPETRLDTPLVGWTSLAHQQHQVVTDEGGPVLRLERKSPQEKIPAIGIWFGPMESVRFIRIRCESRWEEVVHGTNPWNIARFVVAMKDHSGRVMHPQDSVIFAGTGTSAWKKDEVILELTGDMADSGLQIAMLGNSGLLEVRDLTLVAVRQRWWVPVAATALVIGWIAFCAGLMHGHRTPPARWRTVAAASVVVAVSWITVFPQTKGLLRPSLGGFAVGAVPVSAVAASPVIHPSTPPPPPPPPPVAAIPRPPAATPDVPAARPAPEPARRQSGATHKLIRESDKRFHLVHLGTYTAFTFAVLLITGQGRQWRLPLAVAVLSEIVPAVLDHLGDWDDWTDLLQNLAGVALAAFLLWPLWQRFRKRPCNMANPNPETAA